MKVKTPDERWEKGIPHDPRAEALARAIAKIDEKYNGDQFDWRFGGDGDNGESLTYLLDIYFELEDAKANGRAPK